MNGSVDVGKDGNDGRRLLGAAAAVVGIVVRLLGLVAVLLECNVGIMLELKVLELGTKDSLVRVGAEGDAVLQDMGVRAPFIHFLQ
jgi:hypothetical protein